MNVESPLHQRVSGPQEMQEAPGTLRAWRPPGTWQGVR